jgi:hypothetical protein
LVGLATEALKLDPASVFAPLVVVVAAVALVAPALPVASVLFKADFPEGPVPARDPAILFPLLGSIFLNLNLKQSFLRF